MDLKIAPQIADDVSKSQEKIDATELMLGMVESVYPKYYSAAEIQELANFYKSAAFQKTVAISLAVNEESKRTGMDPNVLWTMHSSKISPQEKKYLEDFQNSVIGKKQRSLAGSVNSDSYNYLMKKMNSGIDEIVEKYAKILTAKMAEQQ